MQAMTPEDYEIQRKQKMAELLRQQQDPLNGQMVSGHYVPSHWLNGVANLLKSYSARKLDDEAMGMQKQANQAYADTLKQASQAGMGQPQQTAPYQSDTFDAQDAQGLTGNQTITQQAIPGDMNRMAQILMGNPRSANMGLEMVLKQAQQKSDMEKAIELERIKQSYKNKPTELFGKVMPGDYTPESLAVFAQTGNYADLKPTSNRGKYGAVNPGQFTPDSLAKYQETGDYADLVPFRTPTQMNTGDAIILRDPATGKEIRYKKELDPNERPSIKGAQAEATAIGKAKGEATGEATTGLQAANDKANYALSVLDAMVGTVDGKKKAHPGLNEYVGTYTGGLQAQYIPGSKAADFKSYHDQVTGQAFLEAFQSLRGGGQITEIEGAKATQAITRMNRSQSQGEYVKAARELQGIIKKGIERMQTRAGSNLPEQIAPQQRTRKYNPSTGRIE